jgi:MoxR-like ATPase
MTYGDEYTHEWTRPSPRDMSISVPRSVLDASNTLADLREQVRNELEGVVVGYADEVDLLLVAAVAGGHVLLEGPPGIAKTLLASSIARVLGVSFKRVQFTTETTPEEIIGVSVTRGGESQFQPGAVFANILLADEINRTPPRTQAALLEAMQERHVTVDGRTHWLPAPFMVIATQNPYEQAGIFPLPESQLDRFLFKLHLEYGSAAVERAVLRLPHRGLAPDVLGDVQPLFDVAKLQTAQDDMDALPATDDTVAFIVDVVRATREMDGVALGASPRASVHLLAAAKAHARLHNRPAVGRQDVIDVAHHVLCHRLIVHGIEPEAAVDQALAAAANLRPVED